MFYKTMRQLNLDGSPQEKNLPEEESSFKNLTKIENPVDIIIHELKQPLLCILVLGERLERMLKDLSEEAVPKAAVIQRDISALLSSVEHMREIMGARSALAKLEWVDYKWGRQLQKIIDSLDAVVSSRNTVLEIHNEVINREAGPDLGALSQILNNLVTNALNAIEECPGDKLHTRKILLRISETKTDENLKIEVHDGGAGIPQDAIKKIFDQGFTTKAGRGGSGFGLWLCRKLVESLDGKIEAKVSPLLGGAYFEVEISLKQMKINNLDTVA